jgi:hypothetical protein
VLPGLPAGGRGLLEPGHQLARVQVAAAAAGCGHQQRWRGAAPEPGRDLVQPVQQGEPWTGGDQLGAAPAALAGSADGRHEPPEQAPPGRRGHRGQDSPAQLLILVQEADLWDRVGGQPGLEVVAAQHRVEAVGQGGPVAAAEGDQGGQQPFQRHRFDRQVVLEERGQLLGQLGGRADRRRQLPRRRHPQRRRWSRLLDRQLAAQGRGDPLGQVGGECGGRIQQLGPGRLIGMAGVAQHHRQRPALQLGRFLGEGDRDSGHHLPGVLRPVAGHGIQP